RFVQTGENYLLSAGDSNPNNPNRLFGDINPSYPSKLEAFSGSTVLAKETTAIFSSSVVVSLADQLPMHAFGAVFTGTLLGTYPRIQGAISQGLNQAGNFTYTVPPSPGDGELSFFGIIFLNSGPFAGGLLVLDMPPLPQTGQPFVDSL